MPRNHARTPDRVRQRRSQAPSVGFGIVQLCGSEWCAGRVVATGHHEAAIGRDTAGAVAVPIAHRGQAGPAAVGQLSTGPRCRARILPRRPSRLIQRMTVATTVSASLASDVFLFGWGRLRRPWAQGGGGGGASVERGGVEDLCRAEARLHDAVGVVRASCYDLHRLAAQYAK
eukprot:COSAG01_NODE_5378_length_4297_cov_3.601953_4_plen_173_part_00